MSFAQQRLWFLDQLMPGNAFYNVDAAIRLRGRLDWVALDRSLREICRRHGTLRTTLERPAASPSKLCIRIRTSISLEWTLVGCLRPIGWRGLLS